MDGRRLERAQEPRAAGSPVRVAAGRRRRRRVFVLLMLVAGRYGYHRDELYLRCCRWRSGASSSVLAIVVAVVGWSWSWFALANGALAVLLLVLFRGSVTGGRTCCGRRTTAGPRWP